MYGAKVTIDLIDLGNNLDEAIENVNAFLDWCDKASSKQEFVYETTDYEINVDTPNAVDWYNQQVQENEFMADKTDHYDEYIHIEEK